MLAVEAWYVSPTEENERVTHIEIEKRLSALVGLPLWAINRASTLQSFQFGPRRVVMRQHGRNAGTEKEVGSHALHVQCAWRIRGSATVVVASRDRYRCDIRVQDFVARFCPCRVLSLRADPIGALELELEHGHVLDVFPDESRDGEQWRFFCPYEPGAHAVFSGSKLRDE